MEKSRTRNKKQFRSYRLLAIVFFALVINVFSLKAAPLSFAEIKLLKIVPTKETICTNEECQFLLNISGVAFSNVRQERMAKMIDGVNFVSSKLIDYSDEKGERGTQIEFWFSFRNPGTVQLPPIRLRINSVYYSIPFEEFTVYENPKTIQPRAIIEFTKDGKKISSLNNAEIPCRVGETLNFTIYVQYAVQVRQFSWVLPRNAIFKESKRYDIENRFSDIANFSVEKFPVAEFEWTILKNGKNTLPEIKITAISYSGSTNEIRLPNVFITATEESFVLNDTESASLDNPFAYAFAPGDEDIDSSKQQTFLLDVDRLADLRSAERNYFPFGNPITQERKKLELSANIKTSENEPSIILLYVFLSFFALSFVLGIILFIAKKRNLFFASLFAFLVFGICIIIFSGKINQKVALVKTENLSPVPEEKALSTMAIVPGTRVKIKETVGDWYFVEYNKNYGWIKNNCVIIIKNNFGK